MQVVVDHLLRAVALEELEGVALGKGDELVPFGLGAVGAPEDDEAPVREAVVLEGALDNLADGVMGVIRTGSISGFLIVLNGARWG